VGVRHVEIDCRQRDADVQCHVDAERDEAHAHRRLRVLPREITRRQHLHEAESEQAPRVRHQRVARHPHIVRVELAVTERGRGQGAREHEHRHGGGRHQHDHESQRPVERAAEMLHRLRGVMARQARQDDGRQRDAEDAQRKFHEAIGEVQPGDTAQDETRDLRVDQQAHLRDGGAEYAGQHQLADATHAVRRRLPAWPAEKSELDDRGDLESKLQRAAHEHAHRESDSRILRARRDPQRHDDHDDVHDHLRERGQREPVVAVEDAREQRGQGDEK
jgi:hypothetical protein